MKKLSLEALKEVFKWASKQKDRKGRSLLERARESLLKGSYLKYNTSLELSKTEYVNEHPVIYWDCNCPAASKGKHKNKPCKHVIARLILTHEKELRKHSKKWDAWFTELENKQKQEALKAFSAFSSL